MKAVILAGGSGTRLQPLTLVTNKHLLPVYDKPIIYYSIEKLVEAGIDRIMIVTSPHHVEDFISLIGSGEKFRSTKTGHQIQVVYGIQNKPGGIAEGLCIAEDYVDNEDCVLWLGDNIVEDSVKDAIENFKSGATIFVKEVHDPERFGVAEVDAAGIVVSIEEKPKQPKSNLIVAGVYIYDNTVFSKMKDQPYSDRGEKEITYVNNKYIEEGTLSAIPLKDAWFDAGTFDSLLEASNYMQKKSGKHAE
jgi:glucose-1-phosphate thymidylyltransferase